MDDVTFGLSLRRVRLRRNERQADVAARARMSPSTYSRVERGHIATVSLTMVRSAAGALDIRVELVPRWRGGDLDRLLRGRHAAMSEAVTRQLIGSGWEVAPEVSFNHYGERGVIDLVAWHPAARTLLIVELKTEIVDVNELLGVMDRRCRIAPQAVRERGWVAHDTSAWIVVAESRTNRRRIAEFRSVLRAAFPEDGRSVAGWLSRPTRQQRALWILPDARSGTLGRNSAPIKRVRSRAPSVRAAQSQ
jgi:transcriptional regulator with XRE-family HTH domain